MNVPEEIIERIKNSSRFLITSHRRPDGDSIGSQLALAEGLRKLGKVADIVNADPYPRNYGFLPGIEKIRIDSQTGDDYEIVVVLDCSDFERSGVEGLSRFVSINIDHHPKNDHFAGINWVVPEASAVGVMVFELLRRL
jgi:phosphoesterase RecJ-like protein